MSTKYIASNWRLPNEENSGKSDNYGLSFDGSEFINCGDDSLLNFERTDAFSISAWLKTNATSTQVIFNKLISNVGYQFFINSTGKLGFYAQQSASVYIQKNSTAAFNNNSWHHVVITYDGSSNRSGILLYANGNAAATTDVGSASLNATIVNSTDAIIGSSFNGSISEVTIFDYALSSTQISTLYGSSELGSTSPMALKPQPVGYWPLGDNSASNPLTQPNEAVEDASVFDFVPNDYIDVNDSDLLSFGNGSEDFAFSVSTWVNFDDVTNSSLFSKSNVAPTFYEYSAHISSEQIAFGLYSQGDVSGSNNIFVVTTSTLTSYEGSWINLTFTYDGSGNVSGLKIYLNGDEMPTSTVENGTYLAMTNTAAPFKIGRSFNNRYLNGKMSNLQVWGIELSETEIETLYNSGVPLTGTQPQASSLKAWYKLDQSANWDVSGSGNWTIPDASGNGNDGTSSGMTSANLVLSDLTRAVPYDSYSFNFDAASSDYIDCGNDSSLNMADNGTDSFTFSFWIKRTSTNTEIIISKQVNSGSYNGFEVSLSSNKVRVFLGSFQSPQAYLQVISTNTITGSDWKNVIITYDGSQTASGFNMYINKVKETLVTLQNTTPSGVLNSANFQISGRNTAALYSGSISNVSYWNTALTSTEIQKIYNSGVPGNLSNFTPSPISWWSLGSDSYFNGTSYICPDLISTNNGTSSGMDANSLIGDAPNSTANGTSTNMTIDANLTGNAPNSSNNSFSVNMSYDDRETDVPS